MYCQRCMLLFDGEDKCPECGKTDKLGQPRDEDLCFLMEEDAMWGDMLSDVFQQNGISFTWKQPREGWMSSIFGASFDKRLFYVAYSDLEKARSLAESLLHAQPVPDDAEPGPEA